MAEERLLVLQIEQLNVELDFAKHCVTGFVTQYDRVVSADGQWNVWIADSSRQKTLCVVLKGSAAKALANQISEEDKLTVGGKGFKLALRQPDKPNEFKLELQSISDHIFIKIVAAVSTWALMFDVTTGKMQSQQYAGATASALSVFKTPERPTMVLTSPPVAQKYTYTELSKLADLSTASNKPLINVYGVVRWFLNAQKTSKGPDPYYSHFRIVDATLPPDSEGITIMVFGADPKFLPDIRAEGDIVRCHRLQIQSHQNKTQGLAKKNTSIIVFDGSGDSFQPRQSLNSLTNQPLHATMEPVDRDQLTSLRNWIATKPEILQSTRAQQFSSASGAPSGAPDSTPRSFDSASDLPYLPTIHQPTTKQANSVFQPRQLMTLQELPDTANHFCDFIGEVLDIVEKVDHIELSLIDYTERQLMREQQWVLVVAFWDTMGNKISQLWKSGQLFKKYFVYLTNLATKPHPGKEQGYITGNLRHSPYTHFEVFFSNTTNPLFTPFLQRRERSLQSSSPVLPLPEPERKRPRLDVSSKIFPVPPASVEPVKLAEIISSTKADRFIALVHVIGFFPGDLREFTRLHCSKCDITLLPGRYVDPKCNVCGDHEHLDWIYFYSLRIADETAEISVICDMEQGSLALGGVPAVDLNTNNASLATIRSRLNKLGEDEHSMLEGAHAVGSYLKTHDDRSKWEMQLVPGPASPKIKVCVMAFTNAEGHRRYKLFSTSLFYPAGC